MGPDKAVETIRKGAFFDGARPNMARPRPSTPGRHGSDALPPYGNSPKPLESIEHDPVSLGFESTDARIERRPLPNGSPERNGGGLRS